MKILMTETMMIALENIRRIERKCNTTNHTRRGTAYSVNHHSIVIIYTDGSSEHIECGEDASGEEKANDIFNNIYKILIK